MKQICLLLISLLCICCKQQEVKKDLTKEVVVCGKVLNRNVYPNEKALTLIVPFFSKQEMIYISPLSDDGTFTFRFPSHASFREVSIRNYAEHLYVHPGDSLYVEIDFKDLLHPKVTGTSESLNRYITIFTEGGYYLRSYPINRKATPEEFEKQLKMEYSERQERRNDFLKEYSPGEEVEKYTADMLLIDYYTTLFGYAKRQLIQDGAVDRYYNLLAEINPLFSGEVILANQFQLAGEVASYLTFRQYAKKNDSFTIEDLVEPVKGQAIMQYLYANFLGSSLLTNDTTVFATHRQQFDSIVQAPHLRQSVIQLYKRKVDYLMNPRNVSDYLLYGSYPDSRIAQKDMPHMVPIYNLLKSHEGKVIYLEFWGTWCGPCLQEIEPLKVLRTKYSPEDVVMISICASGDRKEYEKILKRFSLKEYPIQCIFREDWMDSKAFHKLQNQLNIDGLPYYLLFNREGVIVGYGSALRPSIPGTSEQINECL